MGSEMCIRDRIHIGDERTPAGRYDEKPSTGLSEQLEKYNIKIG